MDFFKLFSGWPTRDEQNQLNSIIKGYPLTNTPVVPDILKHQVEFKRLDEVDGVIPIAFTLAHEGSDLVEPASLEVIRRELLHYFRNYPKLMERFKTALPSNLIAISFAQPAFTTGDSCLEFKLAADFRAPDNAFFTYRKLSECIQSTYYNVDGVEHLAGTTFYPAPHDTPMLLGSNNALLYISNGSVVQYPPCDRNKSFLMRNCQQYGRFCATAERHVLLKLSKVDGIPRHDDFNHVTKEWKDVLCKECLEEFFTYKWEEPKKDLPAADVHPVVTQRVPAASVSEQASPTARQDDEATATDRASTTNSSVVTHASSTESLLEGFEKIDVKSSDDDDDSDIDAESID